MWKMLSKKTHYFHQLFVKAYFWVFLEDILETSAKGISMFSFAVMKYFWENERIIWECLIKGISETEKETGDASELLDIIFTVP